MRTTAHAQLPVRLSARAARPGRPHAGRLRRCSTRETLQSYTPANGVNIDDDFLKVRNLLIIADASGQGRLSASLVSQQTKRPPHRRRRHRAEGRRHARVRSPSAP